MQPVPRLRALVTDLDNTLYPWVDYIVPSLEAMVDSLVANTGLPRVRIVQSLKAVYGKYQSNEYPFAIQESEIFAPYEADFDSFNALVLEPARQAFKAARERFLHPYPGVKETLEAVRARGLKVVALTDAPRNAAELRLKWLRMDGLFDALYTLPGYALPDRVDPEIRRRQAAGHYTARAPVVELPLAFEKPDPRGLRRVLDDLGLAGEEVLYVGDNVKKDMPVAQAWGRSAPGPSTAPTSPPSTGRAWPSSPPRRSPSATSPTRRRPAGRSPSPPSRRSWRSWTASAG
jgi:phosphoglycolate phosphatase